MFFFRDSGIFLSLAGCRMSGWWWNSGGVGRGCDIVGAR